MFRVSDVLPSGHGSTKLLIGVADFGGHPARWCQIDVVVECRVNPPLELASTIRHTHAVSVLAATSLRKTFNDGQSGRT